MKKRIPLIIIGIVEIALLIFVLVPKGNLQRSFLIDPTLYDDWDKLKLVNGSHPLPKLDEPDSLINLKGLVPVNDSRDYLVNSEVAKKLKELLKNFHLSTNNKYDIRVTSAYRSYDYQEELYNRFPEEKRKLLVATPGCSEHQSGLAVDIAEAGIRSSKLQETEFYKYLTDNAYKYGFIIRYPEGKTYLTGVKFEPWHIRYVGIKHAKIIYEKQYTYEQYWEKIFNKIYTV